MATLIIGLIVAGILFLSARQLYRDKKKGKSQCGGKCANCPNGCACHGDVNRNSPGLYQRKHNKSILC